MTQESEVIELLKSADVRDNGVALSILYNHLDQLKFTEEEWKSIRVFAHNIIHATQSTKFLKKLRTRVYGWGRKPGEKEKTRRLLHEFRQLNLI